jgi:hypothetical protein
MSVSVILDPKLQEKDVVDCDFESTDLVLCEVEHVDTKKTSGRNCANSSMAEPRRRQAFSRAWADFALDSDDMDCLFQQTLSLFPFVWGINVKF